MILLHYHYTINPKHGKGVCAICQITFACPDCVAQLDKYCLPNISPSSQPWYTRVEFFTITKNLNITMIVSS